MTDRLNKIFAVLPRCESFADIGCDHGYIAKAMLKSGKCEKVIISDISAKCLEKAENLLDKEIKDGKAQSVVSNGFDNVDTCQVALIAGMGGEEICDILSRAKTQDKLPKTLVVQPMKNCDRVRLVALDCGYAVKYDKLFKSAGKFYNLIVLEKGKDFLTEEEIEFGRDNVKQRPAEFKQMIAESISKLQVVLQGNLSKETEKSVKEKIIKLEKYV